MANTEKDRIKELEARLADAERRAAEAEVSNPVRVDLVRNTSERSNQFGHYYLQASGGKGWGWRGWAWVDLGINAPDVKDCADAALELRKRIDAHEDRCRLGQAHAATARGLIPSAAKLAEIAAARASAK